MAGPDLQATNGGDSKVLVHGFLHLMLSQMSSRILTFLLNWLVVKRLSPDDYGLAAQFQLLTASILFLSREGFRRGCLRSDDVSQGTSPADSMAKMITVAWLSVPTGMILAIGCCVTVIRWQHLPLSDPYAQAISLLGLAAIIEVCSEPLYILAQALLLMRLRVVAEGAATLTRCLVTYALLVRGLGLRGGIVFSLAEVAYSSTLLAAYWGYFLLRAARERSAAAGKEGAGKAPLQLCPSRVRGHAGLDRKLLRLCGVFSGQAVVKHFLGKGAELVLTLMETRYNQGVYNLVANLGSLVVRSVLQPFEESAFLMFAMASKNPGAGVDREQGLAHILLLCIKLTSLLGLLFVSFGPSYAYTLLVLLYGPQWASGETPSALAWYCFFIMALALNGITEAFLHAVGDERQLGRSNAFLVAFSLVHMALNVALIRIGGAAGLLLANCCNMAMRTAYSLTFINRHFQAVPSFRLSRALPSAPALLAFALSASVTRISEAALLPKVEGRLPLGPAAGHVAIGCSCLAGLAAALFFFERQFLRDIVSLVRHKDHGKSKEE